MSLTAELVSSIVDVPHNPHSGFLRLSLKISISCSEMSITALLYSVMNLPRAKRLTSPKYQKMSAAVLKMQENRLAAGAPSRTPLGKLTVLP